MVIRSLNADRQGDETGYDRRDLSDEGSLEPIYQAQMLPPTMHSNSDEKADRCGCGPRISSLRERRIATTPLHR